MFINIKSVVHSQFTSNSYHPYLFFNQDKTSITFVGFNAKPNGDLLDPVRNKLIEPASLSRQLYSGLEQNGVNLSENYKDWNKQAMIKKIGMVMGLESVKDPDPSYVLTVDNVIKILAIQMRFRCILALGHLKLHPPNHLILPPQVQHPSGDHGRNRVWKDPPHSIHV